MSNKRNKGQVMILSVLLISSVILSASALAGMLLIHQLRRSSGAGESAQAVFAADAGVERALWNKFRSNPPCDLSSFDGGLLEGKATYEVVVKDLVTTCDYASSIGKSGRSARAFEIYLDGICSVGNQGEGLCD